MNNKFEKPNLIKLIRNLPDYLVEDSGIFLPWNSSDKHEREFLASIRELHRSHADWLAYYLLDETELLPELTFTRKINFKLFAERTMSYYRLAQEVFLKSFIAQKIGFEPLLWTAHIEIHMAKIKLSNSYIQPINNIIGKVEGYNLVKERYNNLKNELRNVIDNDIFLSDNQTIKSSQASELTFNPFSLLEYEAIKIARHESDFRNNVLNKYYREQKKFYARLKNSPFQLMYINHEGELNTIGNGVRGKGKGKRKTSKRFY